MTPISEMTSVAFSKEYMRNMKEAHDNLEKANLFFTKLSQDASLKTLSANQLYYKILSKGEGNALNNETSITVNYRISDANLQELASAEHMNINLSEVIPSFACGIKGMKINETREVYIHPKLAYGVHTFLPKSMPLIAKVTLEEIHAHQHDKKSSFELEVDDFSFVNDQVFLKECEKAQKEAGRRRGQDFKDHFTKSSFLDVDKIFTHLENFPRSSSQATYWLTPEERNIVNRIHWNIYFSDKQ